METEVLKDLYAVYREMGESYDLKGLHSLAQRSNVTNEEEIYFLVKCLDLIEEIEDGIELQRFVDIISNILRIKTIKREDLRRVYKNFLRILSSIGNDLSAVTGGVVISVLHPFKPDRFSGIILWRNLTNNRLEIEFIRTNQSDKLAGNNAVIAGYVPLEFLDDLIGIQEYRTKQLQIQIVVVLDDAFKDFFGINSAGNLIGVRIPQFCKKNKLIMFKARFPNQDTWLGFGQSYYDSINIERSRCILEEFSFFGVDYYESVPEKFCIFSEAPVVNSKKIEFDAVELGRKSYPRSFCLDKNLDIPSLNCTDPQFNELQFKGVECWEHPQSPNTAKLYRAAIDCLAESMCHPDLDIDRSQMTYVDYRLELLATNPTEGMHPDDFSEILEKSFESIVEDKGLVTNLLSLLDLKLLKYPNKLVQRSNFFSYWFKLAEPDVVGVYKFNGNSPKFITRDNYHRILAETSNSNLEFLIYLNRSNWELRPKMGAHIFAFYPKNLAVNPDQNTKSYTIGILENPRLDFNVYLKSGGEEILRPLHDNTSGFDFIFQPKSSDSLVFISGDKNDECGASYHINTFNKKAGLDLIGSSDPNLYLLDAVIQPLFKINPIYKLEYYDQHLQYLHPIQFVSAGLSLVGIASITTTSITLKGWYSKRFYIVQLSISQAYQALFSVLNPLNLHQLCYLLLYYAILSQFFWMLLLGVIQYLKFIKIQRKTDIGVKKSLLIGWIVPAVIVLTSILADPNCVKCATCIKNAELAFYFTQIPAIAILLFNLIIYVGVMVKISQHKQQNKFAKTNRIKTAIILPFVLGFYWFFWGLLLVPVFWINLIGWYFVHVFVPSQCFVMFIFLVVLDDETKLKWRKRLEGVSVEAEKNVASIVSYGSEKSTYKSCVGLN